MAFGRSIAEAAPCRRRPEELAEEGLVEVRLLVEVEVAVECSSQELEPIGRLGVPSA